MYATAKLKETSNETISAVQNQLRGATIVAANTSREIGVGSMISVMYQDGREEIILIDGRTIHRSTNDQMNMTRVSTSSPVGAALLGCREGETVTYTVPDGTTLSLRVTKVH